MFRVKRAENVSSPSSCEFLSDRIFFLVSAGPTIKGLNDHFVAIRPPLSVLLRTTQDWGGERHTPVLTHQELFVVQGCHDMIWDYASIQFSSQFPAQFSLGNLLQFHC